jgi:uncharacterized membrane protein
VEGFLVLVGLGLLVVLLVSPILSIVALVRSGRAEREVQELKRELAALRSRPAVREARAAAPPAWESAPVPRAPEPVPAPPDVPPAPVVAETPAPPVPEAAPPSFEAPPIEPPPVAPPPVAPPPISATGPLPPVEPRRPVEPRFTTRPATPSRPPVDFATNLGPRLLVAAGALAFVVFLGLFVKYAWENNWVGPAGRVLTGALTGVALVIGGLRLLDREYRPLGQGLAGAGLAGLYVSAFAAHGFYNLVPRPLAGFFMVAITAAGVLLAARLDTRLLAALAWIGGYLTPVLLSTGEDKALALYLYLALLNAGALVLDHKRPWGETLPLAATGTVILYGGWFSQHFTPEKFFVAALGLVLFTAMFAIGAARKEHALLPYAMVPLVTIGLVALTGADQPWPLMFMSLGVAGLAVWAARTRNVLLALFALGPASLPLMAWGASHYEDGDLFVVAAWLLAGVVMFVVPLFMERVGSPGFPALLAVAGAGFGSMIMAAETDRPAALLVHLLLLSAVAIVADRRFTGTELVGALGVAASVLAWAVQFHEEGRDGDLLMLALPLWAAFLVQRVARGQLGDRAGLPALLTQVVVATMAWTALYNALYPGRASLLGFASVALAAAYLALGLAAWKRVEAVEETDRRYLRLMLGLAATFLTIAVPVQLGLHGITVAWAVEGALLVALGLRFQSGLTRMGGILVLGMATLRLFARHTPLHPEPDFVPLFNPAFATWFFVILVLAVGAELLRRSPERLLPGEQVVRYGLATVSLVLLFGLLTTETNSVFDHAAGTAMAAGDADAAVRAEFMGRMAVSILWTVFATGLLGSGLFLRSRPLFYAAYVLFAVTAFKVTVFDLEHQHPLFRMVSFLALGLLLLAGAWLNIRFRARMAAPEEEAA